MEANTEVNGNLCAEPLISIIIPVYNREKYIKRCVDSILLQTYKNIEVIIVDDGSNDNSYSICEELKHYDERIVLIKKENGGVSTARNKGLDVARGNYIGFVDSDDYIDHTMYEKMLAKFDRNIGVVSCKIIRDINGVLSPFEYWTWKYSKETLIRYTHYLHAVINDDFFQGVHNKLFKRSLLENIRFVKAEIMKTLGSFMTLQMN